MPDDDMTEYAREYQDFLDEHPEPGTPCTCGHIIDVHDAIDVEGATCSVCPGGCGGFEPSI